ncbi:hypothetical protein BGZ98_002358 [Dissophora globulifera]|nr:hypothetical protein BGZ98_002358 [Dissophora globulifera]
MSVIARLLELPEIVRIVGQALPRDVQVDCLRVCKLWHAAIAPLVWKNMTLRTGDIFAAKHERPPLEGLRTYCRHIRKLNVTTEWKYDGESKLDIEIWRVISDMLGLQELTLFNLVVDTSAFLFFEKTCAHLKVLHLYNHRVDVPDSIKTSAQWAIRELSISEYCQIDAVAFAAQCPALETFEFNTKSEHGLQKCQSLARYLDSGALPCLKYLDLKVATNSDAEIASFLGSMRCLRKLQSFTTLGPLSLPVFRPHFHTISEIHMHGLFVWLPGFWKEIMSSCPLLTRAKLCMISASDILHGAPWVCTSMKALHLDIRPAAELRSGPGSGHGHETYGVSEVEDILYVLLKRISHLEALEELKIGGYLRCGKESPELLPGKGLELLSTLGRLRELCLLEELWPVLHMEAAEWIEIHLKALERLGGSWRLNSRTTRDSVWMLREYGLDVSWEGESKHIRNGGRYNSL